MTDTMPGWLAQVTPREHEVLLLLAKGLNNHEITEQLFVSMATVKTHVAQLLRKTGSRDRVHLVVRCWAAGLVATPSPGTLRPPPQRERRATHPGHEGRVLALSAR